MRSFLTSLGQLLHRVRSGSIEFGIRPYQKELDQVHCLQDGLRGQSDEQLRAAAGELRRRAEEGVPLDRLLFEAFALGREAAARAVGLRPYDEQMLAAFALHHGKVVQMQTGEGKTLAAVLPALLHALSGRGVHVLTFNDYLARRDASWMGPVYEFLGVSVGFVQQGMSIAQRQAAYAADATYVTAKEAGFDFLRDEICMQPSQLVHRPFHYAIVDEADSILIDEARVPLVIAGETEELGVDIGHLADIVRTLDPDTDYELDEGWRNVNLTTAGLDRVESMLAAGDLHSQRNVHQLTRVNLALQAEVQLKRDVDYLVRDGKIELIDEFTGRVAENRRWPYGLQAAIEAKEGVAIQPDGAILASITLQHYLNQYERLAGMTGTAVEAADEIHEFYDMKVVVIPTHEQCVRHDDTDLVFDGTRAKQQAVTAEIVDQHAARRPVLVGTSSVEESEQLAAGLRAVNITCRVLNARNDEEEAAVIAEAGALGAVTISTNMAGRGTDIRLGGRDEAERDKVVSLGGLYVIGTNRHESRRIDNQLRGRAGRQGDPGRARFFVSLEDDLLARYGMRDLEAFKTRTDADGRLAGDENISHQIAHSQRVIEGETFDIRRTLRRYSTVVERQRQELSQRRRAVLLGQEPLELLARAVPERYRELQQRFGPETMQQVEREITLFHINRCWSDHLCHAAEIRDQIHLFSMGGYNPLDEFHRQINAAFNQVWQRIDEGIVETFRSVQVSDQGIDLKAARIAGPSSTWTYMINDTPMGDVLDRLTRGIKKRLVRKHHR